MEWKRCRNCGVCYGVLLAEVLAALTVLLFLFPSLRLAVSIFAFFWGSAFLFFVFYWLPRYCRRLSCSMEGRILVLERGLWLPRKDRVEVSRIVGMAIRVDPFGRLWKTVSFVVYTTGGRLFMPILPEEVARHIQKQWEEG